MKYLFFLISLVSASALYAQPANPQVIDEIVAVVGNEILLRSDIEHQKANLKETRRITNPDECEIIEELLIGKLMLHQAKVDSVEVKEQQVQSELDRRMRHFLSQFGGNREKMEAEYGKSIAELKEDLHDLLEDQMRTQQIQQKITEDINVTPADVEKFYRDLTVDSIPLIGSQIEVAQIVIFPTENSTEVTRVVDQLEKYRKQVKEGTKDFSLLATLYSDDKGSAVQGGELGMVEKGTMVPEFDAVAMSLTDGELSKVFKTQFGYHVMQMIERKGEKYNARHILLKVKSRSDDLGKAKSTLDSILVVMKRDSLSFEKAAVKFSMDDDTKNNGGILVNNMTGSPRFDIRELDPQVFYTVDKLEVGEMSGPVLVTTQTERQGYRVLKVIERTQPHRANLREDYQTIQEMAGMELRQETLDNWVKTKINTTYIKLDTQYENCGSFMFKWKKN